MCDKCERQALRITSLINASQEDWSYLYKKDPKTHAKLIKKQSKWQIELTKYLKDMSNNAHLFVNWAQYHSRLNADYNIDVIINDEAIDAYDGTFINISLELVAEIMATGGQAGENIYKIPLGIKSTDANIQKLATDKVASLVGKKVLKDGTIVDNPNATMNINETTRNNILQSIKTSLALGETSQEALIRMQDIIYDPGRAQMISQTESVNAYQQGLSEFANESGAVGKEWDTFMGCEICQGNTNQGAIPINGEFQSGDSEPSAHPNCKCGLRYIYKSEWDNL